jgi:hypothetical protein
MRMKSEGDWFDFFFGSALENTLSGKLVTDAFSRKWINRNGGLLSFARFFFVFFLFHHPLQ